MKSKILLTTTCAFGLVLNAHFAFSTPNDSSQSDAADIEMIDHSSIAPHGSADYCHGKTGNPTTPVLDNRMVDENTLHVGTVASTAPNGRTLNYQIVGGFDHDRFQIDPTTGAISFTAEPDYESPLDFNRDNKYELQVQAEDGSNRSSHAFLTIQVRDVNEVPTDKRINRSQVAENTVVVRAATETAP